MTETVPRAAALALHSRRTLASLALALSLALPAAASRGPSDLCRDAALRASEATGVPVAVLMAITLTETGRRMDGALLPWPWALNAGGDSHWLDSRDAALAHARHLRASGRENFDLGCFQINYRWHGTAFDSLADMLDPDANALYAARFLARLHGELGDWSAAAGRYHSATPVHAQRYRARFETHLAALADGGLPARAAGPRRENRFPLLAGTGGGTSGPGSLVPLGGGATPFFAAANRPFWGDR